MANRIPWHRNNTNIVAALGALATINLLVAQWMIGWVQVVAVIITVVLTGLAAYWIRVNAPADESKAEQQK